LVNGTSYSGTGDYAVHYMRLQGHLPVFMSPPAAGPDPLHGNKRILLSSRFLSNVQAIAVFFTVLELEYVDRLQVASQFVPALVIQKCLESAPSRVKAAG